MERGDNDGEIPNFISRHLRSRLFGGLGTGLQRHERRFRIPKRERNGSGGTAWSKIQDPVAWLGCKGLKNPALPASVADQNDEDDLVDQLGKPIPDLDEQSRRFPFMAHRPLLSAFREWLLP